MTQDTFDTLLDFLCLLAGLALIIWGGEAIWSGAGRTVGGILLLRAVMRRRP